MHAKTIYARGLADNLGQYSHGKSTERLMDNFWGSRSIGHNYEKALFRNLKDHVYTAMDSDPCLVIQTVGADQIFAEITVDYFPVTSTSH